jgi:hypothetical protein
MTLDQEAVQEYRSARDAYLLAANREDAAFRRYFAKRRAGEPTNGAAVSRLANLAVAQGKLHRLEIDPWDIDDADGVERTWLP